MEYYGEDALEGQNPNTEKDTIYYAAEQKENQLRSLLAELGGDSPQNRAIAEGLQKQGIGSTKDIGVKQVPVPGHFEGTDEAAHWVPETTENAYFNKATGNEINPTRLGIYDVKDGGKVQGNIFFHLNADDNGNVSFQPQWSPRAHGFLRDNAVGRLIMTAGKIIPSPAQPFFVAASAIDALAHGNVMQAVAAAIPYGIQQLASSAEVLSNLSGNADFVSTAKTAAGKIAEAAGAPAYAADLVGKVATSGITAGITGGDVGEAMLKAGANSLLGESKDFLKAAGDFSKMGIGGLLPEGIDASNFDADALESLGEALKEVDVSPADVSPNWEGKGWGEIGEGEFADEIRPTFDLTGRDDIEPILDGRDNIEEGIGSLNNQIAETSPVETPVIKTIDTPNAGITSLDPKDLQSVYEQENPGAANVDVETANMVKIDGKEYFLNDQGGASVQNPDGLYTNLNAQEFAALGEPDEIDSDGTLDTVTVTGGKTDSPEYSLEGGAGPNYVSPEKEGMVDDAGNFIDVTAPLTLPPGAPPDEKKPEEKYLLNPDEESPAVNLPKVPPIFPPAAKPPIKPSVKPPEKPVDPTGLSGLIAGLITGTALNQSTDYVPPVPVAPVDLTGGYKFNWNSQATQAPVNGIAYGQRYFGPHWTKDTTMTNDYAEGGLMALDKTMESPTFKPTMGDNGIQADELSGNALQAIHHLRQGGHVIDHKLNSKVSYLANKGEPVHHIVGFMNHQKRMAEGGIASHSLGSYSDGGHLLKGPGDGMSDDIPATIADKQPARLANEEFVIPADVVSHLGNGSSESGAKVLYEMMARIRKARTGNPKQGKQIDPHKLLPKV